ncbi:MAG TPA: TlpA family protein disulfide reductase [Cyclobacteriaceae bacterium]
MSKTIVVIALVVAGFSASAQVPLIRLAELQKLMETPSDEIKVVNFWATWCAPCIKELPLFEKVNQDRKDAKVTLVSMDIDLDPNPEKVYKFVSRKKIQSQVVILNERNPNDWIDKIEKEWSGALPATLLINTKNGKRKFVEKELHEGDLEKLIDEIKN